MVLLINYKYYYSKLSELLLLTARPLFLRCLHTSQPLQRVWCLQRHTSTVELLGPKPPPQPWLHPLLSAGLTTGKLQQGEELLVTEGEYLLIDKAEVSPSTTGRRRVTMISACVHVMVND